MIPAQDLMVSENRKKHMRRKKNREINRQYRSELAKAEADQIFDQIKQKLTVKKLLAFPDGHGSVNLSIRFPEKKNVGFDILIEKLKAVKDYQITSYRRICPASPTDTPQNDPGFCTCQTTGYECTRGLYMMVSVKVE